MEAGCSAGERLVQFALNHFDRIHSQRAFQSLMQQEMIRLHRGERERACSTRGQGLSTHDVRVRQAIAEVAAPGS